MDLFFQGNRASGTGPGSANTSLVMKVTSVEAKTTITHESFQT